MRVRLTCIWIGLALIVAACGAGSGSVTLPAGGTPGATTGLDVGQIAPDFTVQLVTGQTVSLESLRGRVILLNFWATWCAPCRKEMPYFQQLANSYDKIDFLVLAINFQEQADAISKFASQLGLQFDIGLDPKGAVNRLYAVNQYPVSYVIGRDGTILARQLGQFDPPESLAAALKKWIAGS